MTSTYVLAVDVGQANGYIAVSILHSYKTAERGATEFDPVKCDRRRDLVHLERFRELPHPDQIRRIAERFRVLERHARSNIGDHNVRLVVDATGVREANP